MYVWHIGFLVNTLFFRDPLAASSRLLTKILKAGQVEKRADQKKRLFPKIKLTSVHSAPVMEVFIIVATRFIVVFAK